MAWKKLDDELTDPNTQEPLSAFLVRGLTRNVNDYSTALTRGGAFAFPNEPILMQWASYDQPNGLTCSRNRIHFLLEIGRTDTNCSLCVVSSNIHIPSCKPGKF